MTDHHRYRLELCPHDSLCLSTARTFFHQSTMGDGDGDVVVTHCGNETCVENMDTIIRRSRLNSQQTLEVESIVALFKFQIPQDKNIDDIIWQYCTTGRVRAAVKQLDLALCTHQRGGINPSRIRISQNRYHDNRILYMEVCRRCEAAGSRTYCMFWYREPSEADRNTVGVCFSIRRNLGPLDSVEDSGWQLHRTHDPQHSGPTTWRVQNWTEWISFIQHKRRVWSAEPDMTSQVLPRADLFSRALGVPCAIIASFFPGTVICGEELQRLERQVAVQEAARSPRQELTQQQPQAHTQATKVESLDNVDAPPPYSSAESLRSTPANEHIIERHEQRQIDEDARSGVGATASGAWSQGRDLWDWWD